MAFERRRWTYAAGLAVRGAVCGCLVAAGIALLFSGRPALAAICGASAVMVGLDLVRNAAAAERAMRDFVDQVACGSDDLPIGLPRAFGDLENSIGRALRSIHARTASERARQDGDAALLDTVPAALFVIDDGGALVRTNRAARSLALSDPRRFADHPAFCAGDVETLLTGGPVSGRIIRLTDGCVAHASVARFEIPGGSRRLLIAVQPVSEALGAVEVDAWHRLSRVLAHEMMNSLSPVISLADSLVVLAEQPDSDPDRAETAAAAATISRRATHLIRFVERYRQMLDLPQPEIAPVPAKDLVEDLAALTLALDRRVTVQATVTPSDLIISVDRELIEQAMLNLLKNAVEAARDTRCPTITLDCHAEGGEVELVVGDNGPGLPEPIDDLFLPFFTTKRDGAGLGLAIARQIAVAHDGKLVAVRRDAGAAFSLRIPAPDRVLHRDALIAAR